MQDNQKLSNFMCKRFAIAIISTIISISSFAGVKVGAEQTDYYLPFLKDKRVALVVNQTSTINNIHLLDTLLSLGINVKKVFAPEHGFRGNADAGEEVSSGLDVKTGIPIISVYGKNKKPSAETLADVDVVVFDIQDVGARFYTYISTMHYVMEACAENNKEMIILDRPNPNDFVDGPVLQPKFQSFVGVDPIPVLHGCTVGELALMINGEHWLANGLSCNLKVVPVQGWKHKQYYELPIKPSPNLPNQRAVELYPSLCFFEGTDVSVGRGTIFPFQVIGYPEKRFGDFSFVPHAIEGMDKNPLQNGRTCYGMDFRKSGKEKGLQLAYIIDFYKKAGQGESFFTHPDFFDKLAGTDLLRTQLINGCKECQIRKCWKKDLKHYQKIRRKYLLYAE